MIGCDSRTSGDWASNPARVTAFPRDVADAQEGPLVVMVMKSANEQRGAAVGSPTSPGGKSILRSLTSSSGSTPPDAGLVFRSIVVVKAYGCEPPWVVTAPPGSVKRTSASLMPKSAVAMPGAASEIPKRVHRTLASQRRGLTSGLPGHGGWFVEDEHACDASS